MRFAVRSAVVVAVIVGLGLIVAAIVYANRVRIVNRTLALLVEPFRVSVESIDFYPLGSVRISNLHLEPKAAPPGTRLASIPEAIVTYRIGELRATQRLDSIALKGVHLRLDDPILGAFANDAPPSADEAIEPIPTEPFLISRLALFTGILSVEDGSFDLDLSTAPRMQGKWEFKTEAIDFDETGLTRAPFSWLLHDVRLGPEGNLGHLATFSGTGRLSADLSRIEIAPVAVEGLQLALTPEILPPPRDGTQEGQADDPTLSSPAPAPKRTVSIESLAVKDAAVSLRGFTGDGTPLIPDLEFGTTFVLPTLRFADGAWSSDGPLSLVLSHPQAGSGGLPFFSAESLELSVESPAAIIGERRIASVQVHDADLLLTDETLARFLNRPPNDNPASEAGAPWIVERLDLGESSLLMKDLHIGDKPLPGLSTSLRGEFTDLRFGGVEGFASAGRQSLVLGKTRLQAPGAAPSSEPLLSLDHSEIEADWADFDRENLVEKLSVRGAVAHFTDEALGDWLRGTEPGPDVPRPLDRPVYKVRQLSVADGRLVADSSFASGMVPKVQSTFSVETLPPPSDAPESAAYSYRLGLHDLAVRNHARAIGSTTPGTAAPLSPVAEAEVVHVDRIDVDFTAAGLQRTQRIEKVMIDGATLTVGEGIKAIAEGSGADTSAPAAEEKKAEPTPAPAAPAAPPTPPSASRKLPSWTVGEIEITRSRVHFESLIPQVEGLQFSIETRLAEIPLSLDGILAQEQRQKIELAGIEIRDPYDSFITVAELPTIFVEFSLAGLARQEIERIDLVGPSLHVGQGLFWWIDYQRKFREQNEGASIGFNPGGVTPAKQPDWVIRTINATSGKIIISPTGVPLGVVPFPFDATTSMSGGNIELKLSIPDGDHVYRFPDYKIELEGLVGDIQFNVPVKEVDNNLVQTFTLRKARWKDFEASGLYLSVTFDANGVYGQFGGSAYEGYAEGQFNFYLDDKGKWDAWIAGTEMDTGPITRVLVPGTFLMEGCVSLKVLSEGRDKTVGETSGEFQTTTPGWFHITKLNSILDNLPPEWTSLQTSLTELSLIALKRFDYDRGAGSLSFLNQEGRLELRFGGDYGTRELNLNVHDQRKQPSAASGQTDAGDAAASATPGPIPEASARPAGAKPPVGRLVEALKKR